MNMKDTVILLMFLLCILGLIAGVYYSESIEPTLKTNNSNGVHQDSNNTTNSSVVHHDSNKTNTTQLNQQNNELNFDNFLPKLIPIFQNHK